MNEGEFTDYQSEMQEWLSAGFWKEVISSNVRKIRYRNWDRVLEVEFKTGWGYEYFDVPYEVAMNMYNASSKGKFVHTSLRGHFRYRRSH